jgi:SAM-dependent methyltransferase
MVMVMRVALIAKPGPEDTGVGRYTAQLRAALLARGHEVVVVHPIVPLPTALVRAARRWPGWDLTAFFDNYPVWVRYPLADLYHFTAQHLATLLLFRPPPGPAVVTVHDLTPWLARGDPEARGRRPRLEGAFDRLARAGLRRADGLIADSAFARASLRRAGDVGDPAGAAGPDQTRLAAGWDELAADLSLPPDFYDFVADSAIRAGLPRSADIADVGCGSGRLLAALSARGYTALSGYDFSARAVELTRARLPGVAARAHNIVESPLDSRYDALFLTEVIEHLTDPGRAAANLHASLRPGGVLVLTFPNRSAYLPWLHWRWLRHLCRWWPWLRSWVMWFTMPYELRSAQPLDHAYSAGQVRAILERAGFRVVARRGQRLAPMLRITRFDWVIARLERTLQRLPVQWWFYRSLFICRK